MGAGLAYQLREAYPDHYNAYLDLYNGGLLRVGVTHVYYHTKTRLILLFPTKSDDWRLPSQMKYIIDGLDHFRYHYRYWGITSIAFPMLGCGKGELDQADVLPVMEHYLNDLNIRVDIFVRYKANQQPSEAKTYVGRR